MNLQLRLGLVLSLLVLLLSSAFYLSINLPETNGYFYADEDSLIYQEQGQDAIAISHFISSAGDIDAEPLLLIPEPDIIETFTDFNRLMYAHSLLGKEAKSGVLQFMSAEGESNTVLIRDRHIADLPWDFWFQLLVATGVCLIGGVVWAAQPSKATGLYALTGLCLTIAIVTASVYSTRSFLIDGQLFRYLSNINSSNAILFSSALASLLWYYPQRLGRFPAVYLSFAAGIAGVITVFFQIGSGASDSYIYTLLIYMAAIVFAATQWFYTRHKPLERAALLWFLLAIFLGTGLFAGFQLIPAALGMELLIPQSVLFAVFLLMYAGIALGLLRYRLFDIDRWWFEIWSWLLGGIAVILVDLALVSIPALGETAALSLALAAVGWIYFPLRQWFWTRFVSVPTRDLQKILHSSIPMFVDIRDVGELRLLWIRLLEDIFSPLSISPLDKMLNHSEIRDGGQVLAVSGVFNENHSIEMAMPEKGRRLFNRGDIAIIELLQAQFKVAISAVEAREEGRFAERDRIRRDIHDDLGARLLTLLHRSADSERPLVREAIKDLRALLEALDIPPRSLSQMLSAWKLEFEERCQSADVELRWQQCGEYPLSLLTPESQHQLQRIVREAVSNALRHASPSYVAIAVDLKGDRLSISIRNDGLVTEGGSAGRGMSIMRQRITDLQGELNIKIDDGCWVIDVLVDISEIIA